MRLNRYMDVGEVEIHSGDVIIKYHLNMTETREVIEFNGDLGVEDAVGTFIPLSDPLFEPHQLEGGKWILLGWFLDEEVEVNE